MDSDGSTFFVYILKCLDSKGKITYYTGSTDNLQKRISLHTQGRGAKYTKGKKLELVHFERFQSRSEAMKREIEIKHLTLEKKKELFLNVKK
jgi:putative endonuclease